jgi:molybdopterin converting factor small subunit
MNSFHIKVRLAGPLREGAGEYVDVTTPVANLGELVDLLGRELPSFTAQHDELFNFAVNGQLVLNGEREVPLKSGDEVELLVAFAGG